MAPARRLPLTSFLVHLSSVVVTICACAALVVFVNAAFLVQTEPDDIVRQCQEEQQEPLSSRGVVCHYLALSHRLPWAPTDPACFVRALLIATLLLSAQYFLACLALLFCGVLRRVAPAFVPWLVAQTLASVILAVLATCEATVSYVGFTLSYAGCVLAAAAVAGSAAAIAVGAAALQVREVSLQAKARYSPMKESKLRP